MKAKWILKGFGMVVLATICVIGLTWFMMTLWNWLIPDLFGGITLEFGQTLGLLLMVKIVGIVFGGRNSNNWGKSYRRHSWKEKFKERWDDMSEEEKASFQQQFKGRCGWPGEPKRRFGRASIGEKNDADQSGNVSEP